MCWIDAVLTRGPARMCWIDAVLTLCPARKCWIDAVLTRCPALKCWIDAVLTRCPARCVGSNQGEGQDHGSIFTGRDLAESEIERVKAEKETRGIC
ncbi:hypothetical protein NDU88_000006 [Pleurodeles waltl]|uniref:Uncharacterized protein n=1 Tax=Pleurodeles waltl TaxID=8319 RepID=A0AAV7U3C6_PLEWA|nr:hypothetical protein NDU88_000006 [Pleurodeles waltl]